MEGGHRWYSGVVLMMPGSPQGVLWRRTSSMECVPRAWFLLPLLLPPLLLGTLADPRSPTTQQVAQVSGGRQVEWNSGDRPGTQVSHTHPPPPPPTTARATPAPLHPSLSFTEGADRTRRSLHRASHRRRLASTARRPTRQQQRNFRAAPPQTRSIRPHAKSRSNGRRKNNRGLKKGRKHKHKSSSSPPVVRDAARATYVIRSKPDITRGGVQEAPRQAPSPAGASHQGHGFQHYSDFNRRAEESEAALRSRASRQTVISTPDTIVKDGQIFHRHNGKEENDRVTRGQSNRRHARPGDQLGRYDDIPQRDSNGGSLSGVHGGGNYFTAEALNSGGKSHTWVAGNVRGVDGSALTLNGGQLTQAALTLGENSSSRAQVTDHHGTDDPILASNVGAGQQSGTADARARAPDAATTHAQIEFSPDGINEAEPGEHGAASAIATPNGESTLATLGGKSVHGSYLGTAHSSTLQAQSLHAHQGEALPSVEGNMVPGHSSRDMIRMEMSDMLSNIMETVHQPQMLPEVAALPPPPPHLIPSGTGLVPAREGLVVASGVPPQESEIGQVPQQVHEEQEGGGRKVAPPAAGQVGMATYFQGELGTPPNGTDLAETHYEDYSFDPSNYYDFNGSTDYLDPSIFHVQPLEEDLYPLYPTPAPSLAFPQPDLTSHPPGLVHQLQTTTPDLQPHPSQPLEPHQTSDPHQTPEQPHDPDYSQTPDQPYIPDYTNPQDYSETPEGIPDHSYSAKQPYIPRYFQNYNQTHIPDYSRTTNGIPSSSQTPDHTPDYSQTPDRFQDYYQTPDRIPGHSQSQDRYLDYYQTLDYSQILDYSQTPDHIPDYSQTPDRTPGHSQTPDHIPDSQVPDLSQTADGIPDRIPDSQTPEHSQTPDSQTPDHLPETSPTPDHSQTPDYSQTPDPIPDSQTPDHIPETSRTPDDSQTSDRVPDNSTKLDPIPDHSQTQDRIPGHSQTPDHSPTQDRIPDHSQTPDRIPDYSQTPDRIPGYSQTPDYYRTPDRIPSYSQTPDRTSDHSRTPDYSQTPDRIPGHSQTPDHSRTPDYSQTPDRIPDYSQTPDRIPGYSQTPDYSQTQDRIPDYSQTPNRTSGYSQTSDRIPDYSQTPNHTSGYSQTPDRIPDYSQTPDRIPDYSQTPDHSQTPDFIPDYSQTQDRIPDYSQTPNRTSGYSQTPDRIPDYSQTPDRIPDYSQTPDYSRASDRIPGYSQTPDRTSDYSQTPDRIPSYSQTPDRIPDYSQTPDRTSDYSQTPDRIPDYSQTPDRILDYSQTPDRTSDYSQTPDRIPGYPQTPDRTSDRIPDYSQTPDRTPGYSQTPDRIPDYSQTPDRTPGYSQTPDRIPDYSQTPDRTSGYSQTPDRIPDYSQTPDRTSGYSQTPDRTSGYSQTPDRTSGYSQTPDRTSGYSQTPDHISGYSQTLDHSRTPDQQWRHQPQQPDRQTPAQPSIPYSSPGRQQPHTLDRHTPVRPPAPDQPTRTHHQPSHPLSSRPSGTGVAARDRGRGWAVETTPMPMGIPIVPGEPGSTQTLPNGRDGPTLNVITMGQGQRMKTSLMQQPGIYIQAGEKIPGAPGYSIPPGFRGRVILGQSSPAGASSQRMVQGFNTHLSLTSQSPGSDRVFASVTGPHASRQLTSEGGVPGLHVTLGGSEGHRPRHQDPQQYSSSDDYHTGRGRGTSGQGTWTGSQSGHTRPSHRGQQSGRGRPFTSSTSSSRGRTSQPSRSRGTSWNGRQSSPQNGRKCGYFKIVCMVVIDNAGQQRKCQPSYRTRDCCC